MSTDLMGLTAAIVEVHKALTNSTDQLGRISSRLENEYARLHAESSSHTNPYNLLLRMRTLQSQLPELRDALLACHHQKIDLVNVCQTQLQDAFVFAQQAQACSSESTEQASSDVLSHRVTNLRQQLSNILVKFPPVNDVFLQAFQTRNKEQNKVISLAMMPSNFSENDLKETESIPQVSAAGASMNRKVSTPSSLEMTSSSPKVAPPSKRSVPSATRPPKSIPPNIPPTTIQNNSELPSFEPVAKSVYNRLPRNLKIQAGKLADINSFYEKVFKFLVENPGGVSDEKLMRAFDETSMKKFEVLRGLAVLRSTKQGWVLACLK